MIESIEFKLLIIDKKPSQKFERVIYINSIFY